jgi:hypothetical protein
MWCSPQFEADGAVRLYRAHIRGHLVFTDAKLHNQDGDALTADGLTVEQNMWCSGGFEANGLVSLLGAHIGRTLNFDGAKLHNQGDHALAAYGLTVDQNMSCSGRFEADGAVSLSGAHIGGTLSLSGATLTNPAGRALDAERLTVDESMLCRDAFTAKGKVSLVGAHIGDNLDFDGGRLVNIGDYALLADGITVNQAMFCRNEFFGLGEIRMVGAHIGLELSFRTAAISNAGEVVLNLERIHTGLLDLQTTERPVGTVGLTNAHVDTYHDSKDTWPADLRLEGFTYGALEAQPAVDVLTRLGWLERHRGSYAPQPYEQLAGCYRRAGREDDARKVAIAKQRRRRQTLDWRGKIWNKLLDWTVGYGYETWKAGRLLLAFVLVGWGIFNLAHPAYLSPAKPPLERPWFSGWLYALDLLLPFADLGYQDAWIARGWAAVVYLLWNLAGWVLITAVVAALSGLIRRD